MSRRYKAYQRRTLWDDLWPILALIGVVVLLALGVNACSVAISSDQRAEQAVANMGWTNVHVEDKNPAWGSLGGCSSDDTVKFYVTGDINGQHRGVQVCAHPPFGGYTVRN
jgi:hypothetical protein